MKHSKSISLTNPDQILSLIVEPALTVNEAGDQILYKVGGKMDLSIFKNATNIEVSNNDITDFGTLPNNLVSFDCSKNKITDIPSSFAAPDSVLSFDLSENTLTTGAIDIVLAEFNSRGSVTEISPDPIIDISGWGNPIPSATGLGYISSLTTNGWQVNYISNLYALTSSASVVSEGSSFTVTISRTNSDVADGTVIPYSITGIQQDDIVEALTGTFTIIDNTASATFNIESDIGVDKYEEGESFTLTLDSPYSAVDISVPIADTTPEPYSLIATPNELEGNSFNVTIGTVNTTVADGTLVPYTITGIQANDIVESLTGNFTINNNTDTLQINVVDDSNIPGNSVVVSGAGLSEANGTYTRPAGLILTLQYELKDSEGNVLYEIQRGPFYEFWAIVRKSDSEFIYEIDTTNASPTQTTLPLTGWSTALAGSPSIAEPAPTISPSDENETMTIKLDDYPTSTDVTIYDL
jgi:hypothetical protein